VICCSIGWRTTIAKSRAHSDAPRGVLGLPREGRKDGQTISSFMNYRNRILLPSLPSAAEQAGRFEGKLHALAMQTQANRRSWSTMLAEIRVFSGRALQAPLTVVGVAAGLVLGLAVAASYVWSPTVNAQQLLAHASAMEDAHDTIPMLCCIARCGWRSGDTTTSRFFIAVKLMSGTVAHMELPYGVSMTKRGNSSPENGANAAVHSRLRTGGQNENKLKQRNCPQGLDSPDDLWEYDLSAKVLQGLQGPTLMSRWTNREAAMLFATHRKMDMEIIG